MLKELFVENSPFPVFSLFVRKKIKILSEISEKEMNRLGWFRERKYEIIRIREGGEDSKFLNDTKSGRSTLFNDYEKEEFVYELDKIIKSGMDLKYRIEERKEGEERTAC